MEANTRVLFRKSDGEVTAVFPDFVDGPGLVTCYAHIGQHGSCSRIWYRGTKRATEAEYADLKSELEAIGYRVEVIQRWPSKKTAR